MTFELCVFGIRAVPGATLTVAVPLLFFVFRVYSIPIKTLPIHAIGGDLRAHGVADRCYRGSRRRNVQARTTSLKYMAQVVISISLACCCALLCVDVNSAASQAAIDLLEEMSEAGLAMDAFTYAHAIEACCKGGNRVSFRFALVTF